MMQGSGGDEAKGLFDQGLSQMAYNVLIAKLPAVAPDVVTFKVLDSNAEKGAGVGAFVIARQGQLLYVPVVMADNQVKPLDILYFKDLNTFLPLTKEWLEEIDKLSMGEMGHSSIAPQTLRTDVDLRNIVIPPTTGRYSYAADADAGAVRVFDEARVHLDQPLQFLGFVSSAPNTIKLAAQRLLEKRPHLLKAAARHYGIQALTEALRRSPAKQAQEGGLLHRGGGLFVADKKTKPPVFKELWGGEAGVAFQGVLLKGYHAKDERKNLKRPVRVQNQLKLAEPKEAGAYRLWRRDGSEVLALVVNNAVDFFQDGFTAKSWPSNQSWHKPRTRLEYIGVTKDGHLIDSRKLLGEPVPLGELDGSAALKEAKPRVGQWGLFIRLIGAGGIAATKPVLIKSITTVDQTKRIEVAQDDFEGAQTRLLVFDGGQRSLHAKHTHIFHLSSDYRWVPVKGADYAERLRERDFIHDPHDVEQFSIEGLRRNGGSPFTVKHASHSGFVLDGQAFDYVAALEKVSRDAFIPVDAAAEILTDAEKTGRCDFWAISDADLLKFAAESEGGSSKPKAQAKDPAEAAMDQVMAAQMVPQGPSPIDMAVAEQAQNIQGQIQALNQQLTLLQNVQQRANMIGGGGGASAAPAAAAAALGGPMPPEMLGAGQPVAPMPGQAAPQGAPGQQQPQGAPEQPPMATMTADDGSVDSIAQQVNPQFMDAAAGLQDAGAFDAAALASMAQAPQLKDLVAAYVPNLEKSLDNIGRVLLTLWMDEEQIKHDLGDETYIALEDNLRTVFKGLGALVLKVHQNVAVLRSGFSPAKE